MKKILEQLEYTFWANNLFIERLQEQFELPKEISTLLSHMLNAQRIWLNRIGGRGTLPSVWQDVDQSTWQGINIELYNESCDVVKSNKLERVFGYKTSEGTFYEQSIEDTMLHIVLHSSHHRAQIALLMRQHSLLPPKSDYIYYLRQL